MAQETPYNGSNLAKRLMSGMTPFRKMNGLGNDFVVLDARPRPLPLLPDVARAIADRKEGIGCDQLIVLEPSRKADVFMRIFNADGGEVGACGNAARCVAALVAGERGTPAVSIETESGVVGATLNPDGSVTIDMGAPRFAWSEIPLAEPFHDTRRIELQIGPIDDPVLHSPSVVNVGNPHCLFFVEDVEAHDLARFGPMLEHHPLFPERANISLVQVLAPHALKVRTWERGAGLTRACGTAACAAAVAAARRDLAGRKVKVGLPGGDLLIEWRESDDHILMTGPYALDYEGVLPVALLQVVGA
jgi:diaminopimelate epimerase